MRARAPITYAGWPQRAIAARRSSADIAEITVAMTVIKPYLFYGSKKAINRGELKTQGWGLAPVIPSEEVLLFGVHLLI